jgi:hypothetical protein
MKKVIRAMVVVCTLLIATGPAFADLATLSFDPDPIYVMPGDSFSVDLILSGIGVEGMSGFSFDVTYDSTILNLNNVAISGFLSGTDTSLSTPGYENLFNGYFDPPVTDSQITVASFSFDVSNAALLGSTMLEFLYDPGYANYYATADGFGFVDPATTPGTVNVVPIPPSMLMLGSGLLGLVGFRRKFKKA